MLLRRARKAGVRMLNELARSDISKPISHLKKVSISFSLNIVSPLAFVLYTPPSPIKGPRVPLLYPMVFSVLRRCKRPPKWRPNTPYSPRSALCYHERERTRLQPPFPHTPHIPPTTNAHNNKAPS